MWRWNFMEGSKSRVCLAYPGSAAYARKMNAILKLLECCISCRPSGPQCCCNQFRFCTSVFPPFSIMCFLQQIPRTRGRDLQRSLFRPVYSNDIESYCFKLRSVIYQAAVFDSCHHRRRHGIKCGYAECEARRAGARGPKGRERGTSGLERGRGYWGRGHRAPSPPARGMGSAPRKILNLVHFGTWKSLQNMYK